jgi:hypothetical protein
MKASSKPFHLNNRGVMHLPLLVFSMFAVLIGLSLWGLLHHWKDLMDTQLRLDHCTGEVALDLKSKIATVESANRQIKIIRGSIEVAMATAVPTAGATAETIPELQAALTAEVARQEFQRLSWIEKRVTWVASGCGTKGDLGLPLPSRTSAQSRSSARSLSSRGDTSSKKIGCSHRKDQKCNPAPSIKLARPLGASSRIPRGKFSLR